MRWFGANERLKASWVWIELAIILLTALTPLLWFREGKLITGGDVNFPLDPAHRLASWTKLYDPGLAGGLDMSPYTGSLVFHGIQALLHKAGLSLINIERVQFVFWFALTGLAFYFFLQSLKRFVPLHPLVGTLFWQFNPYRVVTWTEVNVATLAALIFLPTSIALINFTAQGRLTERRVLLLLALLTILTAGVGLNPPILVLSYLGIAAYLLVAFRFLQLPWSFLIKAAGVILGASAFWLYPTGASLLASKANLDQASLNLLDWVEGLSKNTSFWNVVRLQGAWDWYENWRGEPYITYAAVYRQPLLVTVSLVAPFMALLGLAVLLIRRPWRWLGAFSLILLSFGLLFSMGTHPPMRGVFNFLKDHLPFFWIFRSPWYKFTLLTVTALGLLIAVASSWLGGWIAKLRQRIGRLAGWLPFITGASFLAVAFPMLTGQLFPTKAERQQLSSYHVEVPGYVYEMADFINREPNQAGIILLPKEPSFNYTWGYGSIGDITYHLIKRPVFFADNFTPNTRLNQSQLIKDFYRHFYAKDPRSPQILRLLGIKYLLNKRDVAKALYTDTDDPAFIEERLKLMADLQLVASFGSWELWQIADFAPRPVATATDPLLFHGSLDSYLNLIEHQPQLKDRAVIFSNQPISDELKSAAPVFIPIDLAKSRIEDDQIVTDLTIPWSGDYQLFGVPPTRPVTIQIGEHQLQLKPVATNERWVPLEQVRLEAGSIKVALTGPTKPVNLVSDPSFAEPLTLQRPFDGVWQFVDASEDWPGKPRFAFHQPGDGAELTSFNHIMALKQNLAPIDPAGVYLLAFDYQYLAGNPPEFGLWQVEANMAAPSGELKTTPGWQHYGVVFNPDPRTRNAEIYFYARATPTGASGPTRFKVRNVRLVRLTTQVETYFLVVPAAQPISSEPPAVSIGTLAPTKLSFELAKTDQPTLLFAPVAAHNGWQLQLKPVVVQGAVEVNGGLQGFYLPAHGLAKGRLLFAPSRRFPAGLAVTVATITLLVVWQFLSKKSFRR